MAPGCAGAGAPTGPGPGAMRLSEGYQPGAIGAIVQLHARYYAGASGFGLAFEAKVASELAAFCSRYQAGRDGLWLAHAGDTIAGSVVLDGLHARGGEAAHLRWFITSDAVRGRGVGRRLLQHALDFADGRGYERIQLWTFAGLHAARHLYEQAGFRLVHESPGAQWGTLVREQRFERVRP